jgi:hypothetical protein
MKYVVELLNKKIDDLEATKAIYSDEDVIRGIELLQAQLGKAINKLEGHSEYDY